MGDSHSGKPTGPRGGLRPRAPPKPSRAGANPNPHAAGSGAHGPESRGFAVGGRPGAARPLRYFVKYQFSGLMLSVVLCGVTPLRLLATSVSW